MKSKIVVANLKMNLDASSLSKYIKEIDKKIKSSSVVVCPTSIYVPYFLKKKYQVGLQDCFFRSEGAYTGEVSPMQAYSLGIRYVILGHSERRMYQDETDATINKKVLETLKFGLKVILCVGETQEERNMLRTDKVLKRQLVNGLRDIPEDKISDVIIAYEPRWAIGNHVTPTSKEISSMATFIKGIVHHLYEKYDIPVLYGGSVTDKNIKEIDNIDELSGVLVGGASLDALKFMKIVEVVIR